MSPGLDLKSRERKIIAAAAALVLLMLMHMLIVSPLLEKRENLKQRIDRARDQLVELRALEKEYDQILEETRQINEQIRSRPAGFTLFSFLDQTANKLKLKNHLASMKPSRRNLEGNLVEDLVEVRLEGISLENLVSFLYEIERSSAPTAIANIRIQPVPRAEGGLNATMVISSIGAS